MGRPSASSPPPQAGRPGGCRRQTADTSEVHEEGPPICPACGVTMVPAELSARTPRDRDWICLECEETDELDLESSAPRPT
jgi:hypothetical protein